MFDEDDDGLDSVDLDLDDETPQSKALPEAAKETPTSKPLSPEVAAARKKSLDYDWFKVDEDSEDHDGENHSRGYTTFDGDHEIETNEISDRIIYLEAQLQKLIVEAELAATVAAWDAVLFFKTDVDMGEIVELKRFRDDIVTDCDGGRRRFDSGFTVTQDDEDEGEEWDDESAKEYYANSSKIDWDEVPYCYIDWDEVATYLNENESRTREYDHSSDLDDNWYHYD